MQSYSAEEIIGIFENNYDVQQQKEIVKILFRLEHTIEQSELLDDLIRKDIICISSKPYIKYRLEKFFEKKNIEKISDRKDFIFSQIPNLNELKRGKAASYDDLIDFISVKYTDIFNDILSDIKVYSFSEQYMQNGRTALLYLNRKLNPESNYKFNSSTGKYELKNDEITEILKKHNINCDILPNMENSSKKLPIWKIILLVIFWPVGLGYIIYTNNQKRTK